MSNQPFNMLTGEQLPATVTQQNTVKKEASVQLSEDLLLTYKGTRQPWETQAKDDEDFRNGAQWSKAQQAILKKRRQMPIVVNCIHPAVEQGKAMLTTHSPRFSVTGREGSDRKIATVISDVLSYIWDTSCGNVELKIAIDDYYVKGVGWLMSYIDSTKDGGNGEICIRSVDPYDVYVDPNSKDRFCRDAAHILVTSNLTFEQLQRMYPLYTDKILSAQKNQGTNKPSSRRHGDEGQVDAINDAYHDRYEVIDRYSRIKDYHFKVVEFLEGKERVMDAVEYEQFLKEPLVAIVAPRETKILIMQDEVAEAIQRFGEQGGKFHYERGEDGNLTIAPGPETGASSNEVPNSTFTVIVALPTEILKAFPDSITVRQILEDRIYRILSVGGVKIWEGIMPTDDYPIVPLMNHFMRNPYPMSDVRFVRGLQEYINKITSLIVAHASSSANVKVLLPKGSQNIRKLEEEFNKAGTAIIEFDAELGAPVIAQPIPLPGELYKNKEDAKQEIERIIGIFNVMSGDPSDAPQTYKGTVALDEYGQRRIRSKKDDIEAALNQLGRVTVQLMQKVYTRPKVIRIVQPNNISRETQINTEVYDDFGNVIQRVNDVSVGKYDVQVVSGSTLPTNRWARFEYYMSLYETGIIDQIEVLKQTEVVDTEGVLGRMDILRKLNEQNIAMQEQIKKLEGDLQTFERESVHDRKRVEIEKFKSQLNGMLEQIRAASKLYEGRLNDELKRTRLDNKSKEK